MVSQIKVNEIIKQSGSSITIGESGTTISIPSGATIANSGTATGFGESNTPYVFAYVSGSYNAGSSGVWHKLQLDAEALDSGNAFDTSNYRWTPQKAGYYFLFAQVAVKSSSSQSAYGSGVKFYKNSSAIKENVFLGNTSTSLQQTTTSSNCIVQLNGSSDYIEIYGYTQVNAGNPTVTGDAAGKETSFQAFFLTT